MECPDQQKTVNDAHLIFTNALSTKKRPVPELGSSRSCSWPQVLSKPSANLHGPAPSRKHAEGKNVITLRGTGVNKTPVPRLARTSTFS